jgi:hypothetical protein
LARKDENKNPLAQALGLVLGDLRGDSPSKQYADLVRLGKSHYRSIESGHMLLHPNRALQFTTIFPSLQFDSFAEILTIIQVVDSEKDDHAEFKNSLGKIVVLNPNLKKLFDKLTIALDGSPVEKKRLRSIGVVEELHNYLVTPTAVKQPKELDEIIPPVIQERIKSIFSHLPSYYLDGGAATLDGLSGISPYVEQKKWSDWEGRNRRKFISIDGITNEPELLLQTAESYFDYSYIFEPRFEHLRIIITAGESKVIARKFLAILTKGQAKHILQNGKRGQKSPINGMAEAKISIRFAGRSLTREITTSDSNEGNSLWIYNFDNRGCVGIINTKKPASRNSTFVAQNLTYKEAREKGKQFSELWDKLSK